MGSQPRALPQLSSASYRVQSFCPSLKILLVKNPSLLQIYVLSLCKLGYHHILIISYSGDLRLVCFDKEFLNNFKKNQWMQWSSTLLYYISQVIWVSKYIDDI